MLSNVPINPLKDVLTGSTWDKFKELIEPYALINAIIFVVLNLLFVIPASGVSDADSFFGVLTRTTATEDGRNLDVWRLVVGTIVVFVFSYIINHLSAFFVDFASGEIYRNSPIIGKRLHKRQKDRYDELKGIAAQDIPENDAMRDAKSFVRDKAAFRLAYEFPVYEPELGLTRLGNILLNPASYIKHQYGASMQLLWPFIQEKLLDDNKSLKTIQENWISLQFFTSLAGLLVFVGIEVVTVSQWDVNRIWQVAILAGFAGLCYYVCLDKARQWGRGIRRLFDSHLRDVFTDLGMEALKSQTPASAGFKTNWEDVMGWLAYGAVPNFGYHPEKTWYQADAQEWPKIQQPDFLTVKIIPPFVNRETVSPATDGVYISYEYFFGITNTSTGENPLSGKDGFLLIQDDGVSLPDQTTGRLSKSSDSSAPLVFDQIDVVGRRQPGDPDGLLFPLGEIAPGSSRILTYSLPSRIAIVTSSVNMQKIELRKSDLGTEEFIDITLKKLTRTQAVEVTIEMIDDSTLSLNSHIEVFSVPADFDQDCMGEMSGDKRIGTWSISLKSDKAKMIRIRLGG